MRAIHIFSILLIAITAAVCVYLINSTAASSPFSGSIGVTEATAVEWGGEGLGIGLAPVGEDHEEDADAEAVEDMEATEEPTETVDEEAEPTDEATEERADEDEATAEATEED